MSERFTTLFKLPSNMYSVDSPIIVSAGALLKDTETGKIIVQIKYHSVSIATIKALKVTISSYDVFGEKVSEIDEYQYLDLNVNYGQEFGANKAIILPDEVTRSFKIDKIIVILSDGSNYDVDIPMEILPPSESIKTVLQNDELVKQYQLVVNTKADYIPQERKGLWCCSCGKWNVSTHCSNCNAEKEKVFLSLDISTLTLKMEERLVAEEIEKFKQEELAAIEMKNAIEREKNKRKENVAKIKKASLIAGIIVAIIIILSVVMSIKNPISESISGDVKEEISAVKEILNSSQEEVMLAYRSEEKNGSLFIAGTFAGVEGVYKILLWDGDVSRVIFEGNEDNIDIEKVVNEVNAYLGFYDEFDGNSYLWETKRLILTIYADENSLGEKIYFDLATRE